jgi:hypothetical protein
MKNQIKNVVISNPLYTGQEIISERYSIERVDGVIYEITARVAVAGGWAFRSFGLYEGQESIPLKFWNYI